MHMVMRGNQVLMELHDWDLVIRREFQTIQVLRCCSGHLRPAILEDWTRGTDLAQVLARACEIC
jgi:hypothetical protein